MKLPLLTIVAVLGLASSVNAQIDIFSGFDNKLIGRITPDQSDDLNICNSYSSGGSAYSTYSVYSNMGINGSQMSAWGAYNSYAIKSPYFYFKGTKYNITTNTYLPSAINPDSLRAYVCK